MINETTNVCVTGLKRLINKYIWRMDVTQPIISFTPEALVFLYNSRKEYTTLKWTEISEFKFIEDEFGKAVIPIVDDPQKYIDECTSKVIKFGMKSSMKDNNSPFAIRTDGLDLSAEEIAGLAEHYLKENGRQAN